MTISIPSFISRISSWALTSIVTLLTTGKTSQRSLPVLPGMILAAFLAGRNRLILPLHELLLVVPGCREVSLPLVVIIVEVVVVVASPLNLAALLALVLVVEAAVVSVIGSIALFPCFFLDSNILALISLS